MKKPTKSTKKTAPSKSAKGSFSGASGYNKMERNATQKY
jgi:hypothetical protein